MAQMPRGKPRSVPDPVGDEYDEMLRQWKLEQQRAEDPSSFPRIGLNLRNERPRPSPTVTIGAQRYREIDNGKAGVLVPADDPSGTSRRRAALERVQLMAESPLAGAAYGIASLFGASPTTRDQAMVAGALGDAGLLAVAPLATRGNIRAIAPSDQPPMPYRRRDAIRLGALNGLGQATGVNATLTKDMLGFGSKPDRRIEPPGWQGDGQLFKESRGHLLANRLGGTGKDPRNLVTLTQKGANQPQMSTFEDAVRRRVRAGEVVEYSSTPFYDEGSLPPSTVVVTATGSRAIPKARIILNPAGRRK